MVERRQGLLSQAGSGILDGDRDAPAEGDLEAGRLGRPRPSQALGGAADRRTLAMGELPSAASGLPERLSCLEAP
jgi:hypothetical protein